MRNHRTGTRLCVRVTVAQPRVYVYTGNNGHFGPIAPLCASARAGFFFGYCARGSSAVGGKGLDCENLMGDRVIVSG